MKGFRPQEGDCNPYFFTYIDKVEGHDILSALIANLPESIHLLESMPADKWDYAYAAGKWTIKEAILHIIDTERIMAYRALRIARNDKTALPGFEQDDYVPFSGANDRSPESLVTEWKAVREATVQQVKYFTDNMWAHRGTASNSPATPLALAYIIAGHELHHIGIIRDRYL
ncbi:MAG: hypothetical protein DHS20C18_51030 [Saprospiraceae bacterium]|nr:MAG: hypothetical protein DHS20C18_51030 [Saprospiraceae bacterium]